MQTIESKLCMTCMSYLAVCNDLTVFAGGPASPAICLPMTLPKNPVKPERMKSHYTLPDILRQKEPIASEMKKLQGWLTNPVQLERNGKALAPRTLQNITTHIYQYLGFLHIHMKRAKPTLQDYMDLDAFLSFIAFQKAKGNVYTTVQHQIHSASKVLTYLDARGGQAQSNAIRAIKQQLTRLDSQLATLLPKPKMDIGELQAANKWVDSSEVVLRNEQLRVKALQALAEDQPNCTVGTARVLHDACLANCMFGYMAPIRLVSLRILQLPSTSKCLYAGCLIHGCKGNRLEWDQDGRLQLILPHYKVEDRQALPIWLASLILVSLHLDPELPG